MQEISLRSWILMSVSVTLTYFYFPRAEWTSRSLEYSYMWPIFTPPLLSVHLQFSVIRPWPSWTVSPSQTRADRQTAMNIHTQVNGLPHRIVNKESFSTCLMENDDIQWRHHIRRNLKRTSSFLVTVWQVVGICIETYDCISLTSPFPGERRIT